jgi:dimethylhistidine N-methyltransferase
MTPEVATGHGADAVALGRQLADDVRYYLTQQPRQLPSRYLYDALGSALFNAICELPWYRVTRAEIGLLATHGAAILSAVPGLDRIVELGAGNGVKLTVLLAGRPPAAPAIGVDLVDVSRTALDSAIRAAATFDGVHVAGHQATYEVGMERLARSSDGRGRTLVLFLGSNIGNFDTPSADALLRHVHQCLRPADVVLLGTDLVKPEQDLLVAYDDPLGVTAAFNLNLLVRLNRELGADADIEQFGHMAVWNPEAARIEMHLVSRRAQTVRVPGAGIEVALDAGETIWTESSYKYQLGDVAVMLERAGFRVSRHWVDEAAQFALTLGEVRAP